MSGPALVLVSHGTRSRTARASYARFVNAVRHASNLDVHVACLDGEEPSATEVVAALPGPCVVVPMTLFADAASTAVQRLLARHPSVSVAPAIGPDWSVAEVLAQRLIEVGARPGDAVVLAAGRVDSRAGIADLGRAARLLSGVWGGRVHVGTLGGPHTDVADAVDIARAHGGRVVIASYALTGGDDHERFERSGADLVTAPLLADGRAPDPRLVDLTVRAGGTLGAV